MKLLTFNIDKQSIKRTDKYTLICAARNYFYAKFTFGADWDNAGEKHAVFKRLATGESYTVTLIDNQCLIPYEVTDNAGNITVSVYGGDLRTTDSNYIELLESGYTAIRDTIKAQG